MEGKWANYEGADTHIVIKPWIRGAWPMVNDPYKCLHYIQKNGAQNLLNDLEFYSKLQCIVWSYSGQVPP